MKRFLLFALATIMFASCTDDTIDEQRGLPILDDRTLSVSFEGDDTRIQLNDAQQTIWTKGDLVSVFYRSSVNEQWQYNGDTGARTGDIIPVDSSIIPPVTNNRIVVVYPYNDAYYYNSDTYNVQAMLPATQHYLKDSYGLDGNILISSSEYNQILLKSVCGWLQLQLTGDGESITSITLKGNNGEQVAGEVYINSANATCTLASASMGSDGNDVGGTLVRPGTILTEVTLDCNTGITLGAEATSFYIALPPRTFTNGFTVDIKTSYGATITKSTNKSITIERNHIQPMQEVNIAEETSDDGGDPSLVNNKIYYTSSDGKRLFPNRAEDAVFGATFLSNVYKDGQGVLTFDDTITSIGNEAFRGCSSLTSITIPDSVTSIGDSAFAYCTSLTSVTIPDSVTEIGGSAFSNCDSLTSVTIGNGVTSIGNSAFTRCNKLTSVDITDIEAWCKISFGGSTSNPLCYAHNLYLDGELVTDLVIPDSVTSIGDYAFYDCNSLTSVTIPDSVTSIGKFAFNDCTSLTSVTIGNGVTSIGIFAFSYCTSLTSVTIPNSVTKIGDSAFYYCSSLTSVTIPDSVTSIGYSAFENCDSLTSVTIPDSVTEIGGYAFNGCDSLTSVTIPDSVTSIGKQAFYHCDSLVSVYCKATTPPAGGLYMFSSNASERKIYVPTASVEAYKSAEYWSDYADYIEGHKF